MRRGGALSSRLGHAVFCRKAKSVDRLRQAFFSSELAACAVGCGVRHCDRPMFDSFLTKIFGSRNDRLIKQYRKRCVEINKLEPEMTKLTDEELRGKTAEFRDRLSKGEDLQHLLPEAFAVVREASRRVLGMRHFDVQLIGGMVLNDGKIAEMRTGEGKTLTATLAVYLNALPGEGVHVVTVNDYLASRDAAWMGRVYNFLGMTVGTILSQQDTESKKKAYAADITYGTNNEFGFDYLRDNMEYEVGHRRQRGLAYAIVDEVDSILIDEARTPLIISGAADDNTELYKQINEIPPLLQRQADEKGDGDYWVDEKAHQVYISEKGHEHLERILVERGLIKDGTSLYSPQNIILMHHLNASLRAHSLFHRDQQYVVQNGEVIIVDEFTGRLMPGRRWSDGLHQAVEAKEGVEIHQENQTMASITFQNYFRMYKKLSGMTVRPIPKPMSSRTSTSGNGGDSNQPQDDPRRRPGQGVPHRGREVPRDHRGHQGLPEARSAGSGRHDLDRKLRAHQQAP